MYYLNLSEESEFAYVIPPREIIKNVVYFTYHLAWQLQYTWYKFADTNICRLH
jgi:hypothetical protein